MSLKKVAASVFLISIFTTSTFAQESKGPFIITDCKVFDGERVIPQSNIILENGRITGIGKSLKAPHGAKYIDGRGRTLLPGLIDAHVHIQGESQLRQALIFGVTFVVDMFTSSQIMTHIKERQSHAGVNDMAGFISAGILVTSPGGHGTEYGFSIPTLTRPDQAQDFVDERIKEGSDFIKIIRESGLMKVTFPTLDMETITALIEAAHKRNKMAIVHISRLKDAISVIKAGADGLAHIYCEDDYDPGFGTLAAEHHVFVITTLSVLEAACGIHDPQNIIDDPDLSPYLSGADIIRIKRPSFFKREPTSYNGAQKAIQQLKTAGVRLLAGTDAPNPGTTYGASLHRELELLVLAGLTPIEALKAATSVPAMAFGISQRGVIQENMIADLILVGGDPTQDIKATRKIIAIWKNGHMIDRQTYHTAIEREKIRSHDHTTGDISAGSTSGLISDFESGNLATCFGTKWVVSTDERMGGTSKAQLHYIPDGAQSSKGSMLIIGNIAETSMVRWAGAFYSPGSGMMMPTDLSSWKAIAFMAKGDGKTYSLMIMTSALGSMPVTQNFSVSDEWKEYVFPFETLGISGRDVTGIFIGGSMEKGEFRLQIDNVLLK